MKIKDLHSGRIFEYGDCHDSLRISYDGRTLSYSNLQNGDGSKYGEYRFVMDDGETPQDSKSIDAMYGECYFNIGGFPNVEQIRAEVIEEIYNKIDEGVCDICEHKDFENDCFRMCNYEVENAKKWLLQLKEQK